MELKITKEKVIEAANSCSTAKNVLTKLFPEVFENEIFTAGRGSFNESVLVIDSHNEWILAFPGGKKSGSSFQLSCNYIWEVVDEGFLITLKAKKKHG